jgi:tRNA A-37 threonylcarbamoyl transferase component Bud32/tetratricopeptide (TPR) repeat protein
MTQPSPSTNPRRLGRYEIVDELGKGAMGVVYLARDPLIGRLVALKTFRIGYSVKDQELEQFRARFIREAQSAGILSHPGIVTIHDVTEESDEGVAFIAMEYVRGTNLKMLLQREGPLDPHLAASIVDQVADALDYAHSRGVVHRDIKPANIILTADNRVKITDFGIARLDSSNLTQEGQLLGTPNYMAPEQILGRDVDHRADIFSLGIVLYEMLTRHKPFQGDNLTVVSHRIVYDNFTPPRQYAQDLPPGVERVLARALEKAPAQRYQQARELADDLRQAIRPEPTGEALNETMSLTATNAVPLPELLPPPAPAPAGKPLAWPGRFDRLGALLGSPSWERLATEAWVTALVCVLIGATALLSLGWGPVPPPNPAERVRGDVVRLIAESSQLVHAQRFDEAAVALRQAERLAPGEPGLRQLRENAEAVARERAERSEQEKRLHDQTEQASLLLMRRNYQGAAIAAQAVLMVDPENERAKDILDRANESLLRDGLRRPGPTPPRPDRPAVAEARGAAAGPVPDGTEPAASASVATHATLHFRLDSGLPKGKVQVTHNGVQVFAQDFDFYEKKAWYTRRAPRPGFVEKDLTIPVGPAELVVTVTPENRVLRRKTVDIDLSGGRRRQLSAVLDKEGKLNAFLQDPTGS